jgi:hypothetical protein
MDYKNKKIAKLTSLKNALQGIIFMYFSTNLKTTKIRTADRKVSPVKYF